MQYAELKGISLKLDLWPPSAACFVGSGAFSWFYPEDEISCSVLDMPWAVAFPASFSRKIQLY